MFKIEVDRLIEEFKSTDENRPLTPLINPDCILTSLLYDRLD